MTQLSYFRNKIKKIPFPKLNFVKHDSANAIKMYLFWYRKRLNCIIKKYVFKLGFRKTCHLQKIVNVTTFLIFRIYTQILIFNDISKYIRICQTIIYNYFADVLNTCNQQSRIIDC